MDMFHKIMNVVFPLISLIIAVLLIPPFMLFKLARFLVVRPLLAENVAGNVVVITGASSGIGEHVAYEYAKRGACLVLVARREERLRSVARKAKQLGCPDVIVVEADVSKLQDCQRFVDQAIHHFGRLDHLVNNAGIAPLSMFQDYTNVADHASVMDTNFWGSVYTTQFAVPHLRKSKGKIIVITSAAGWFNIPRLSIYGASKAALINFYETLRVELGSDIGITIVTPGLVNSEITQANWLSKANLGFIPLASVEGCAQAIVNGTRRGDPIIVEPAWLKVLFLFKVFCPQLLYWITRLVLVTWPTTCNSFRCSSKANAPSQASEQDCR